MTDLLAPLASKYPDLRPVLPDVGRAIEAWINCYRAGGQVLICGNGGSAADAEHLVGELMKGYLAPRAVPTSVRQRFEEAFPDNGAYLAQHLQGALPTLSLASQTALLTAVANDIAGDMIFAQQVYGYGRRGDVLVAISTSGNSSNVVNALQVARVQGLTSIGFTGRTGGRMRAACDIAICVPQDRTADIQERHLAIYHLVCAAIEAAIFPE
jgi:D-sedoheptulose 7-phosphate isomerase